MTGVVVVRRGLLRRGLSVAAALLVLAATLVVAPVAAGAQSSSDNPANVTCEARSTFGLGSVDLRNNFFGGAEVERTLVLHLREVTSSGSKFILSDLRQSRTAFIPRVDTSGLGTSENLGYFVRYRLSGAVFDIPCTEDVVETPTCTIGPDGVTVDFTGFGPYNLREETSSGSVWRATVREDALVPLDTSNSLGFFLRTSVGGFGRPEFACQPG